MKFYAVRGSLVSVAAASGGAFMVALVIVLADIGATVYWTSRQTPGRRKDLLVLFRG